MAEDRLKADICVIGAGAAGLSVAAGAAQLGVETVLIERGPMGGDCLNYGCVPSKALLAAGKASHFHERAAPFGVHYAPPNVDFAAVQAHVKGVIGAIAPTDSVARFSGLGVKVIKASARFTGPREVLADGVRIAARRVVVATGSQPLVPPIPGLDQVPYLTNETVFDLNRRPDHLIVVGGGPIGCELGQAFRHLGAQVTIVEMAQILPKDDPELADLVRQRLRADGIALREGTQVVAAAPEGTGLVLTLRCNGVEEALSGSHLLLAVGRRPSVEGLDLEQAGIAHDAKGIQVDARLRTSNRKVFAAGDAAGGYQFTHVAGYHAGIVIQNALFRLPAKANHEAVPWVTYTAPELASVGLNEAAARERGTTFKVLRWPFAENDRAQAERQTTGLIKVITAPNGRILGATIVGPHAGELIHVWALALSRKLKISAMAKVMLPYPTLGEVGKRASSSFFLPKLFSARSRAIVGFLTRFG
ncbi:MAG: mercuric reductase [Pseudomonadota bacterium]